MPFIIGCIVCAQKIRGRLLQEFIASWKTGREHSTYCGRNLVCDQPVSQYSIGLWTYHFSDISGWCHWSGQYWLWCIDQFYILFWIRLESGTAYCLNWRYLHWFDIKITSCVVDTEHCGVHSLQVMRTQLETLGEEFKLAGNIWWREPTISWVWTMRCIGIVRTMATFAHLICLSKWEFCDEMFRYCEDNTYIIVIVTYGSYTWSYGVHFMSFLRRLWSTLWIGYYIGRKTSAIQLYLADLHWQCRTEHSILHWGWKLWDTISMWKADLEKELCVLTMFCIQKKVVQIPCVNHFVFEKLVNLWLMSWLFTFGWEPVWFENFWKCFDVFEFI